jgi:hypothetical protein
MSVMPPPDRPDELDAVSDEDRELDDDVDLDGVSWSPEASESSRRPPRPFLVSFSK